MIYCKSVESSYYSYYPTEYKAGIKQKLGSIGNTSSKADKNNEEMILSKEKLGVVSKAEVKANQQIKEIKRV